MPNQKIYLLYHCEYVNFTIYTNVLNEFSEKKVVGLEGSILAVFLLDFMHFTN